MRIDVLTLFPAMFEGYLQESLLNKAMQRGLVQIERHDFRQWTLDRHHRVDDRPFGGGPGMVISVQPVVDCVEAVQSLDAPGRLVALTPQGRRLTQPIVEELAGLTRLLLLCGRYEGFDQRVYDILRPDEISLGDFVLNGGEVAAMAVIDSVIRLIPGVLGDERSNIDDSFSSGNRGLEYPQYTRPRNFRGWEPPAVLFSGNHEQIANWRSAQSRQRTRERRADLLPPPPPSPDGGN